MLTAALVSLCIYLIPNEVLHQVILISISGISAFFDKLPSITTPSFSKTGRISLNKTSISDFIN